MTLPADDNDDDDEDDIFKGDFLLFPFSFLENNSLLHVQYVFGFNVISIGCVVRVLLYKSVSSFVHLNGFVSVHLNGPTAYLHNKR